MVEYTVQKKKTADVHKGICEEITLSLVPLG